MTRSETSTTGLGQALDQLALLAPPAHSTEQLLQAVVDLSVTVLPGDPEASISVVARKRPTTVATSGALATELDEEQYAEGQGPCLTAASTGELTEITDTRTETRWPEYARRAAEHGNYSSISVPMRLDDQLSAALNVYAREPGAFHQAGRDAVVRFGEHAAVAVGNRYLYENARSLAANLEVAARSRAVIDQAKGILMERHRLDADAAFQALAAASMHANRKLRDVADELVTTGALPGPPPHR